MTREETEKIIKEAVQQTRQLIPEFYPQYPEVVRVDIGGGRGVIRVVFDEYKEMVLGREETIRKSTILHWRDYFLSHEFCKERWGEELIYRPLQYSYHFPAFLYHVGEIARQCTDMDELAQYLKDNPKHGKENE